MAITLYRLFALLSGLVYVFQELEEKMVLLAAIIGANELSEQAWAPHFSFHSIHSTTSSRLQLGPLYGFSM